VRLRRRVRRPVLLDARTPVDGCDCGRLAVALAPEMHGTANHSEEDAQHTTGTHGPGYGTMARPSTATPSPKRRSVFGMCPPCHRGCITGT